mmetsp:Transcript_23118/g.46133  ORF Transcript_23118/g.46133 Transcript_23118/m.46133 type:complete len:251 (+) Transcript_23118:1525-2277(+)
MPAFPAPPWMCSNRMHPRDPPLVYAVSIVYVAASWNAIRSKSANADLKFFFNPSLMSCRCSASGITSLTFGPMRVHRPPKGRYGTDDATPHSPHHMSFSPNSTVSPVSGSTNVRTVGPLSLQRMHARVSRVSRVGAVSTSIPHHGVCSGASVSYRTSQFTRPAMPQCQFVRPYAYAPFPKILEVPVTFRSDVGTTDPMEIFRTPYVPPPSCARLSVSNSCGSTRTYFSQLLLISSSTTSRSRPRRASGVR